MLEQKLSELIRVSYLGRNPKTATFKRKLNAIRDLLKKQDLTSYVHDDMVNSTASSTTLAGISGAGKSTATNIILNTYPRVIYHPEYHLLQVPWIKVDCPYDGSLSEFCESFFIALDRRLNTNYRQKYTSGKTSIGKMIADVADLCLIHAIGLLVVDEFQHMNLAKSGGEKKMINFLVTLVNVVEVSVVLIGTPKALKLFANEFRQARRASGSGSLVWDRLSFDESWDDFLDEIWDYQWLKSPIPRNEVITNKLYELSQGVPDILVKLFCIAQARAILMAEEPGEECLSSDLLDDIFEEQFSIVKPMLTALGSNDTNKIERCGDLIIPEIDSTLIIAFDHLKPKPLNRHKKVDMGEASQTSVANDARAALVSMGVADDIAEPLVRDAVEANPELQLIQIIQHATTALSGLSQKPKKSKEKEKAPLTCPENWSQLKSPDMRKLYADKTGAMYELLAEHSVIYPVETLLAG
ncbi:ATP-binding protein [Endozoicomonas acroporae]|uniref:ATP-binding protein n=1 Tax=Endozoicomonas acroporae TaxID=1701104 RepID=UPI001C60C05A|nr:ATP-binding protein [Endozoicomonas acroporae]